MNYSLKSIAKELGVSKSTISLILSGHAKESRISDELEKTVLDFCKKVNYAPNIHARRASAGIAKNIGLLINENLLADGSGPFSDQNTCEITGGVIAAAAQEGFRVTIQFYSHRTNEEDVFGWLRDREIDGLIYYGFSFDESYHKRFCKEGRNVIGIGIEPRDDMTTVNIDNRAAMYELGRALIEKGRRHFVFIAGFSDSYVSQQRLLGLSDALSEYGVAFADWQVLHANFSESLAYQCCMHMQMSPDAIVCANDDMALGVIRALRDSGVRVPEDVSVTGADNIRTASYISPCLTTIDNRSADLGGYAFNEMRGLIGGGKTRSVILKSKVIIRESI